LSQFPFELLRIESSDSRIEEICAYRRETMAVHIGGRPWRGLEGDWMDSGNTYFFRIFPRNESESSKHELEVCESSNLGRFMMERPNSAAMELPVAGLLLQRCP
jgi:hypothetical protein